MTEDQLQRSVINWADIMSARFPLLGTLYHVPNGGKRNVLEAKKFKKMGVRAGVPDLCLPVKSRGYGALYIELKVGKNKPTEKQKSMIDQLTENGNYVTVCRDFDTVIKTILWYIGEKNE